jgi:hypothetical protein
LGKEQRHYNKTANKKQAKFAVSFLRRMKNKL